jgi:hydrogenase 3 maturation protease
MLEMLRDRIEGKRVVVLGVGNPMRGDDGIGACLADRLQGNVNATVVNAGDVPENYLGPVAAARPEVVVIVDAAELGAAPGEIAIVEVNELGAEYPRSTRRVAGGAALSTHNASLSLFIKVLQSEIQTDVFLLGVQPASMAFGAPMSRAVAAALRLLEDLFQSCCPEPTSALT